MIGSESLSLKEEQCEMRIRVVKVNVLQHNYKISLGVLSTGC